MENFEKFSDKKWREYWDDLMLKAKSPVPWGTIVDEKPEHGEKTISEEKKIHKFKRPTKKRFKEPNND